MATPIIESAWVTGEVSPALFGNVHLARMHSAAATTSAICFVSYQGGAYSRAGTAFVGFSKQTGRAFPPRMITFQFSINQGLALEFGNFYMRVVFDGAYVTESNPFTITNVTQANPAVMTLQANGDAISAISVGGATASYVTGDTITLAGGTFSTAAILTVLNTSVSSLAVNAHGTGYHIGDAIMLAGGTQTLAPIVNVTRTQVVSATIAFTGEGMPTGTYDINGTTG